MASYVTSCTYRVVLAAWLLIPPAMAACGSSDSAGATTATTTAPQTTAAPPEIIDITLDGRGCTASEPTVVPAGVQSFVVTDLTNERVSDMRTLAIASGYSYDAVLDLQGQPGEYFAVPDWAELTLTSFDPIDRDLAENQLGKSLILEPGEHAMTLRTDDGVWLCGTLKVTES